jgi:hypothetical protein
MTACLYACGLIVLKRAGEVNRRPIMCDLFEPPTPEEIEAAIARAGCPRVNLRMACNECGYPLCEAMQDTDKKVPHRARFIPKEAVWNGKYWHYPGDMDVDLADQLL